MLQESTSGQSEAEWIRGGRNVSKQGKAEFLSAGEARAVDRDLFQTAEPSKLHNSGVSRGKKEVVTAF